MEYLEKVQSLGEMFYESCVYWDKKIAVFKPFKHKYLNFNYSQYSEKVFNYARAISTLDIKAGEKIALCAETCFEWALVDWAVQTLGIVLVPIYPTLTLEQIDYILKDSESKIFIVANKELKLHFDDILPTYLLKTDLDSKDQTIESAAIYSSLTKSEWKNLLKSHKKEDVATIIYTSGTTGKPKGVMLTHENFLSLCREFNKVVPIDHKDTFLSFLPLSHIYERFGGHVMPIALGCSIGYIHSIASFSKDMQIIKPTVVLCVPRFLESMKNKIMDNAYNQSKIKRFLFDFAYKQGIRKINNRFAPFYSLTDKLVASKIRARTGGNLRFFVSGGSAIPLSIEEFFRAFGVEILQGYGLTETTAFSFINRPGRVRSQTVGEPAKMLQVKIDEDGEILLKGPSIMKGYFNQPQETLEVLDENGWFHTGDIGIFKENYLTITDRKKDILVLGNGKNVAPQPIENILKQNHWIEEVVLLGNEMDYICALIVPNKEKILNWLKEKNIEVSTEVDIVSIKEVKDLFKKEIQSINKNLASFEKIKKFEMISESFTVETGELTPSLKVKRKFVQEKYNFLVKKMQRTSSH